MSVTWKDTFRLLKISCSNMDAISQDFYSFTEQKRVMNQGKFKIHCWVSWRSRIMEVKETFQQMLSSDTFSPFIGGIKLIASKRFLFIIMRY